MDIYHIWFNLNEDTDEPDFQTAFAQFLNHLQDERLIVSWRLTRCKLGLRPDHLTDFHAMIETKDLDQLDQAFRVLAKRSGHADALHFAVNASARDVKFALYRDWPDAEIEPN